MCAEHKNEEAIFKAAIKLEPKAERDIYLKQACGDDAELWRLINMSLKTNNIYQKGFYIPRGLLLSRPAGSQPVPAGRVRQRPRCRIQTRLWMQVGILWMSIEEVSI
jgi:hypothetical protein